MPRDGNGDKKEETELLWTNVVESQSAFLGPNLWDNKTLPYDSELKVSFYTTIYYILYFFFRTEFILEYIYIYIFFFDR